MDMNESRWTLSNVLTISSDQLWHQSLKTRISRQRLPSGLPVLMALAVTEGFDGSNEVQKQLTENWRKKWPTNGRRSKNSPAKNA
jgi:hypothetical protein